MNQSKRPPLKRLDVDPSAARFGLIEEEYADEPFQLLVVCIFLNRTRGEYAIPCARRFLQRYPGPEPLSEASYDDIIPFFVNLGLLRRANWLIGLAKGWLSSPPTAGVIREKRSKHQRLRSEVAHLKGVGKYASEAWRVFCKDDLYRKAGYKTEGIEWTKVNPEDKELAAYVTWRRAKEGLDSKELSGKKKALHVDSHTITASLERLSVNGTSGSHRSKSSDAVTVICDDGTAMTSPQRIIFKAQRFSQTSPVLASDTTRLSGAT